MTLQQAEQYIREYQAVLAEDTRRGNRRNPNLLPTSKENLVRAIKLQIAQLYSINAHSEDIVKPLIDAAMFVDSFSDQPLDTLGFIESMQQRRAEFQDYQTDLLKISRDDRFYWQRVYSLTGVTFETKRTTFVDKLKIRFGIGVKTVSSDTMHTSRRTAERITID